MGALTGQAARRRSDRGRLTERDIEILKFIAENRFATTRAIADRFWKGNGNWNHYRRLRILRARGLLEPLIGDRGARIGYRATRKGLLVLEVRNIPITAGADISCRYRTTLDHDERLITIRRILEASPVVVDFKAEHEVAAMLTRKYGYEDSAGENYKIPDALFQFRTAKRLFRVALELEIAKKSRARYRKFIKQLSLSPDWDIAFVIAERDHTISVLKRVLADLRENDLEMKVSKVRHGIYFIQLADFLRAGLGGKFEGEGRALTLKQFEYQQPPENRSEPQT